MKISYCVTVHNEHEELDRLLRQLIGSIDDNDEIVIQGDQGRVTDEVTTVIKNYLFNDDRIKYIEYPLRINGKPNFSVFKNNLFKNCTGDYIFNIDADEVVSEDLILELKTILMVNPSIEVFFVPRVNIVDGLNNEYAKKFGFERNTAGWINWPDWQMRICKRSDKIYWKNPVHDIART